MLGKIGIWTDHPKFYWVVVAIAIILLSPSLFAGLCADDFFHYGMLALDDLPRRSDASFFGLFSFIDADPQKKQQLIDVSLIPWWTVPDFQYNFWRPLTELTHYVDYVWLVDHELLMHAHSLFWFAILLVAAYRFFLCLAPYYRCAVSVGDDRVSGAAPAGKKLPERQALAREQKLVVLLALAIFAWDSTHGLTISWLANRNAVIAALFSLLTLQQHMRFRQERGYAHLMLAALLLVCTLMAAEIGISVGAYLFAYAVFLDRQGPLRGVVALLPYVVIVVVWWLLYKHFDFGAVGSELYYVDPAEDPHAFLSMLVTRLPLFIGSQFGLIPAETVRLFPAMNPGAVTAGVGVALWIGLLLLLTMQQLRTRRLVLFFLTGALLSMLPISSTIPQDRNMLLVGIGGSGLISILIVSLWQMRGESAGLKRFFMSASVSVLILCHLVISPLILVPLAISPRLIAAPGTKAALSLDGSAKSVVAFNVPVQSITYLMPTLFRLHKPLPNRLWSLTSNEAPAEVERVGDNVLRIRQRGGFLQNNDQLLRNPKTDPLGVGDKVKLSGLEIEVTETLPDGRPQAITATFAQSLSDPQYRLVYWYKDSYINFNLDAGQSMLLPPAESVAVTP